MDFDFITGELLLIDKPIDWTSFDAVNKIRRLISRTIGVRLKVGHAGTLDPKATGLLLVCTGGMTKQINRFMELDKEYTGTFFLGATTPSCDSETEPIPCSTTMHPAPEILHATAQKFTGNIQQVPPLFSAKKIEGKRAYTLARKNRDIVLPPVPVTIHTFEITRIEFPEVDFLVNCSKGTYIRSLARDFGEALGTGAYLSSLRRTRIGNYSTDDAISIPQFEALLQTMTK
ncbi:MAG: tRNA pseudouridine(55) synthase TruB [Bacteroidales bacterium]|nr:tRNA pseudouridine(55) synthase TruB [Bacteroidales bacterium]